MTSFTDEQLEVLIDIIIKRGICENIISTSSVTLTNLNTIMLVASGKTVDIEVVKSLLQNNIDFLESLKIQAIELKRETDIKYDNLIKNAEVQEE